MPAKITISDNQQKVIIDLYSKGKTIAQIIEITRVSYHLIRITLKKQGLIRERGNIDISNGTKICVRCKTFKPLVEFNKNHTTLGYRSECKSCRSIRAKETARKYSELSDVEKRTLLDKNRAIKLKYPERILLKLAKVRAKKMGLPFNLKEQDIIIPTHCPILHIPLQFNKGTIRENSITLDRIVCEKGYVTGNIQVISWKANKLKSNGTVEELELIVNYLKQLNV